MQRKGREAASLGGSGRHAGGSQLPHALRPTPGTHTQHHACPARARPPARLPAVCMQIIWPHLLRYDKEGIAIVDPVCMVRPAMGRNQDY